MSIRCKKPSERCASATKPSGAFSFRQDITAAPTLRKRPLDLNHFDSSEYCVWCNGSTGPVLQTLQFTQQATLSEFFGRPHHGFAI